MRSEKLDSANKPGVQSALTMGYFALCILVFVTNGANLTIPFVLCLWLAGALCVLALVFLRIPEKTRSPFTVALILLTILSAWIAVQIVPIPPPFAAPAWQDLWYAGLSTNGSISLAPSETVAGWLRLCFPFLSFFTTLLVFRSDEQATRAFRFISYAASVATGLCLLQFLVFPKTLLFVDKTAYQDSFTFFFVNRNTAATFLGLLTLMLVVIAHGHWLQIDKTRLVGWILNGVGSAKRLSLGSFLFTLGLLLIVLVGLALTKSRGGIGATSVAVAAMAAMLIWRRQKEKGGKFARRRRSVARRVLEVASGIVIVLVVVGVFAPRAILRGEVKGTEDARFCVLDGLISAARDNWLTGSGFGAFGLTFNPYRDPACGVNSVWDKAHNSYLEGFIGLGFISAPLLLVTIALQLQIYRKGLRERRRLSSYPIAGIAGLILVMLHGLVDFSLQIPGVAFFYAMFTALTVSISLGRTNEGGRRSRSGLPPLVPHLLVCSITITATVGGALAFVNAIAVSSARAFARAIDSGVQVDQASLDELVRTRLARNRLTTCNGEVLRSTLTTLLVHLDQMDRDRAYQAWEAGLQDAEKQVLHSLTCMPSDGNLWLRLAMLRQAAGEQPEEQASLMRVSQQFGPADREQLIGRLTHWNRLSSVTLSLAKDEAESDIRNALNYLSITDISNHLASPSVALRPKILGAVRLISAERKAAFQKAGLKWVEEKF